MTGSSISSGFPEGNQGRERRLGGNGTLEMGVPIREIAGGAQGKGEMGASESGLEEAETT